MTIKGDAACAYEHFDSDWWYPEPETKNIRADRVRLKFYSALEALEICSTCPLLASGECLEYTFQSLDSVRYGISAGLLPTEKMKMAGIGKRKESFTYWDEIRAEATKRGIVRPEMSKREAPKPSQLYKLND